MPAICVNCKNVIINGDSWDRDSNFKCKTGRINYVTGEDEIKFCKTLNPDGNCKRFIPKK